jgi:hypothetical protein
VFIKSGKGSILKVCVAPSVAVVAICAVC